MSSRAFVFVVPLAAALFLFSERAARLAVGAHAEEGLLDPALAPDATARILPTFRALLAQLQLIRIDAAASAGDLGRALRYARQTLAIAPDLEAVRVRLASVLAFDLASREAAPASRIAWVAEALNVLDDGIRRAPRSAALHLTRGIYVWWRGQTVPEFAAAYERATGRSTLDAGVDSLVAAASYARFDVLTLNAAAAVLLSRAEDRLDRAKRGDHSQLEGARGDFDRAADYLRTVEALADRPSDSLHRALELAEVSAELIALNEASLREGPLDAARQQRLDALRARRIELRQSSDEGR